MDEDLPVGERVEASPARPPERRALEGRFVRVRPLDPEADADELWDVSHDGSAQADRLWTSMYEPFADRAAMRAWLDRCAASSDPLFMTVESRGGGPVGMAAFMNVVPEHRRLEIGHIWYAPSAQRTEANTEAAYLMIREAFDGLGNRRVEWKCDALNERSRAAALRLGFTFEGVFRTHMIVRGRSRDSAYFSVVDDEWRRRGTRSSGGSPPFPRVVRRSHRFRRSANLGRPRLELSANPQPALRRSSSCSPTIDPSLTEGVGMDRRTLMMTGVVAGSVGLGSLIGAIAFAPGIGMASDDDLDGPTLTICGGTADSIAAAAGAIGISTSELVSALRGGRTIAEVAEAHEVPVAEVVDAVVAAEQDRLDVLVADGRLTQEQADALSADLQERATDLVNGDLAPFPLLEPGFGPGVIGAPGPFGRPGFIPGPGPWVFVDAPLAAAADAIGIDESTLLAAIADGQTIADVARAHDVEVSEVVDSIVASMQERLDEAVENGRLARDQAEELAEGLSARATDLVNGQAFPFPHPGWRWPPGRAVNGTTTSELSLD